MLGMHSHVTILCYFNQQILLPQIFWFKNRKRQQNSVWLWGRQPGDTQLFVVLSNRSSIIDRRKESAQIEVN